MNHVRDHGKCGAAPAAVAKPTTQVPEAGTTPRITLQDLYQVVLYNDDRNSMEFVVRCLMRVFGHTADLAAKIMLEAHARGRAIAEVEEESEARQHRDQLQAYGLNATVEKV